MTKPDFDVINNLIYELVSLDRDLTEMMSDRGKQEEEIRRFCRNILMTGAEESLSEIPVDELRKSRAGIRVSSLLDAGYDNLRQLYEATDYELLMIEGIGAKQIDAIRAITTEFINRIADNASLKITASDPDTPDDNNSLIHALCVYMKAQEIRDRAEDVYAALHAFTGYQVTRVTVRSALKWFFTGKKKREQSMDAVDEIAYFMNCSEYARAQEILDQYRNAVSTDIHASASDFRQNSAAYYACIENLGELRIAGQLIYSSIPSGLAEEIDSHPMDLTRFRGNLRSYQVFGAKYMLHQKRVLIGDEMGLGKTVQAIAAITHLGACGGHFLIICPAGLLINWCREITRFSSFTPYLIHGHSLEKVFDEWKESGGIAVTNYESMGRIIDRIDNRMNLSMTVIDEAHFIKNPNAQRTKHIYRLYEESEHLVLMSGTPLENKVDELCSLITFIRPDLDARIRELAQIAYASQFKEALAPVYLRRTREQVLTELPPIEEINEWCEPTEDEMSDYHMALETGNIQLIRRVSFTGDDLSRSSKALRLSDLCENAYADGRKVVVFSFFKDTIRKVTKLLGERCVGVIDGDTEISQRQQVIDLFADAPDGSVLVCQVQTGGTGFNIQTASIVIFCEPQMKPSLTRQAVSRVYRMGQINKVMVFHLLCADTIDEAMVIRLQEKQLEFDTFADESAMAQATDNLFDREWIREYIEKALETGSARVLH